MKKPRQADTILTHGGRDTDASKGAVNIPPFRASTVLFDSTKAVLDWDPGFRQFRYGRFGTPTTAALEDLYAELEGADRAVAASCGMSAISMAVSAFVGAGDHMLVTHGAYDPGVRFCTNYLTRFGVETETFEPDIGAGIGELLRPNTRMVYLESPSSMTFEVQDVPKIVETVKRYSETNGCRILTMLDNTWATPLNFRPIEHGVDIVVQAATKYIVGHADAMLGIVACSDADFMPIKSTAISLGINAGSEEIYLGLRGLRTLSVRMERHFANAMKIAEWLQQREEVARVLFPPLPGAPGHELWKRDFNGGSSLMGIVLKPGYSRDAANAMLDGMELFGMGFSWGGFESLLISGQQQRGRNSGKFAGDGPMLRLYAGLENVDDLIADLDKGFGRLNAAAS